MRSVRVRNAQLGTRFGTRESCWPESPQPPPSAVVNVAPVPERNDDHKQDLVSDRVDDAVVTDTNAKSGSAPHRSSGRRARIPRQECDCSLQTSTCRRVELAQRSEGGRPQFDPVRGHSQPRSAFACSQGMFAPSSAIAASNARASSASSNAAINRS